VTRIHVIVSLVLRSNQMIQPIRLRPKRSAVSRGVAVNHVFDSEHSHVRLFQGRRVNSWLHRKQSLQAVPDKAGGAAAMTTVDHTLMRGSRPHDR